MCIRDRVDTAPYSQLTAAFRPQSEQELKAAVDECIKKSPTGECSEGQHGPMGDWDVSHLTSMGEIFSRASTFNQNISEWNVSAVADMRFMFFHASAFNQDLSKWDVSSVIGMKEMFSSASTFNQELSKWDVSAVTNMESMFSHASAFNQDLSQLSLIHI